MCPVDTIRCTGTKFNSVCKLDLGSLGTCPIPRPVYDIPWLYGGLYGLGLDDNVALFYLTLAKQYGWDYSGVEYDSRKEDMGCITIPRVNLVEGNPVLAPKGADFAHVREFNNGNKVMMLFDFVTDPTLEERDTDIIACESLRSEIEGWLGG